MEKTISATEARVHFGQWLRRVAEQDVTLVVERGGKPEAVVLSMEAYARLLSTRQAEEAGDALSRARALRERIRARRKGAPLPAPEDVIAEMRRGRGDELDPMR